MNQSILKIINATDADRILLFSVAADKMDVRGVLIEKDFWVCVVLDVMFNTISPEYKDDELFLFKGGTSLSKCFNKVDRFSEDIDIVVSRRFLGFHGDNDPLSVDHGFPSQNKRRAAINSLAEACSSYVTVELKARLEKELPGVTIELDPKDPTTLHVNYPSVYPELGNEYVRRAVKVEAGAKSEVIPSDSKTVRPYISDHTDLGLDLTVSGINTILPERTFLDKLLILHGWNIGVKDSLDRLPNPENRLSRHYYDVAMLWNSELKPNVLEMEDLLESVRSHNIHSGFARAWMKTKEVTFHTLEIVPNKDLIQVLRRDYKLMSDAMMFGDIPSFDWIVESISDLDAAMKLKYPRPNDADGSTSAPRR